MSRRRKPAPVIHLHVYANMRDAGRGHEKALAIASKLFDAEDLAIIAKPWTHTPPRQRRKLWARRERRRGVMP